MPSGFRDHPLRQSLTEELHARPFARLDAPLRATHLALMSGEDAAEAERAHAAALCRRYDQPPPGPEDTHYLVDLGAFRLRWERHTEFSTYTFFVRPAGDTDGSGADIFAEAALEAVPQDWRDGLAGELLVGTHLALEPRNRPHPDTDSLAEIFGTDNLAGSLASNGAAAIFLDFRIHHDGFGRILVYDRSLRPRQAGRLVQRLLEIDTYRAMALLALPVARRFGTELNEGRDRLSRIAAEIKTIDSLDDERRLLRSLTALSADVESAASPAVYRFGATRAYYALVRRRVEELRETRVEGLQTIHEFLDRRLAPAMRTCEAVGERVARLSERISRTGELLRTRVDVQLEAQNSALLQSMDRRARLQLRLQKTVEGLSVAAISYYLVSLLSYVLKSAKTAGLPLDPDLWTGISVPFVVAALAAGVWRLRRRLERDEETASGGLGED